MNGNIVSFVTSFVDILMCNLILVFVFRPKLHSRILTVVIGCFGVLPLYGVVSLFDSIFPPRLWAVQILFVVGLYLMLALLLYRGSWSFMLLTVATYFSLGLLSEYLSLQLLERTIPSFTRESFFLDLNHFAFGMLVSKALLLSCIGFLRWLWKDNVGRIMLNDRYALFLLVIPATSDAVFFSLLFIDNEISMFIATGGILILNLVVFYAVESISKQEKKAKKHALLRQQSKFQEESIATALNQFDYNRRLMHDIDNHLGAIVNFLRSEDTEDALAYAQKVMTIADLGLYRIKTGSHVVDGILNEKNHKAIKQGTDFVIEADGLELLSIDPFDLVTIMGNLLNNALEATAKCSDKRYIHVKIRNEDKRLYISVKNSINQQVEINGDSIESSKYGQHGYGLSNVKLAAEAYNGDLDLFCEDSEFTAVVTLRTKSE